VRRNDWKDVRNGIVEVLDGTGFDEVAVEI